ncbi:2'-5' RNA ligase family protein [Chitinophagaceae bacterium LB-8]|uniref:2'-5' RNA ligase family protein n=1 Tax=Paraflavisolibacter caeni TaxID=2982496 RepID=A0A9X2XNR9_9BACT|nr:2'-5' RNA ligase family protein [Paraflavisolibacter caeni]MCU7549463.1 2'-5' RNA ligase family protein [Paraflavisolibacter caeni]
MNMYFIAIVLPQELNEKVLHWKKYMHEKYHCKVGLKSPAHITIIPPFWLEENMEEELLNDVEVLAKEMAPFQIGTNNFSAFKPRTIYIAVTQNPELKKLKHKADQYFSDKEQYGLKIETRQFNPHITIATRDLFKKDFYESWPFFETKEFKEEWNARSLSVLRHNKRNWDVIYAAPFGNSIEPKTL